MRSWHLRMFNNHHMQTKFYFFCFSPGCVKVKTSRMMWFLGIWILTFYEGVLTKDAICMNDSYTACAPPNTFPLSIPADKMELEKTCSIITEYMPCVRNHELSCKGSFQSEDKYNKVYGTVKSMCAKESLLHKALANNIKCIKRVLNNLNESCFEYRETIKEAYQSYLATQVGRGPGNLTVEETDVLYCLEHSYEVGCFLMNVEECGSQAKEVSLDIIKMSGYIQDGCPGDSKLTSTLLLRYLKLEYYQEILIREVLFMNDGRTKYKKL